MAPFSSLFEFVTHHHHGVDSSSSSSSESSTCAVDPILGMRRPLSAEAEMTSTKSTSSTRRVSFFGSVKVQFIECLDEYTAEEKKASWFDKEEFLTFRRDRRETVKCLEQGNSHVDDGEYYFRGLEGKTRKGSQRKQFNMVESSLVVFDEQMYHQQHGESYSTTAAQSIAEAYSAVTAEARAVARERGLHDQRAALEAFVPPVVLPSTQVDAMPRRLSCRAA